MQPPQLQGHGERAGRYMALRLRTSPNQLPQWLAAAAACCPCKRGTTLSKHAICWHALHVLVPSRQGSVRWHGISACLRTSAGKLQAGHHVRLVLSNT